MKTILTGLVIGTFTFAGVAVAARVGEHISQGQLWGFVKGQHETFIYKVEDAGVTCFVAQTKSAHPDMECVGK